MDVAARARRHAILRRLDTAAPVSRYALLRAVRAVDRASGPAELTADLRALVELGAVAQVERRFALAPELGLASEARP